MDANGLRCFGLSLHTASQPGGLYPWPLGPEGARLAAVEPAAHVLTGARLASRAALLPLAETAVDPDSPPDVVTLRDAFGHALVWSRAGGKLMSLPARPWEPGDGRVVAPIELLPAEGEQAAHDAVKPIFDLAMSARDIVFVAGQALTLMDTRGRFKARQVLLPGGFSALMNETLAHGKAPEILHFILGTMAWEEGETRLAKEHFQLAYDMAPHVAIVANNLAYMLAVGDPPEPSRALNIINPLVEKFPANFNFRDTRGQIYAKLGRWQEAIMDLEFALSHLYEPRRTHAALATAYQNLGMRDLAAEHERLSRQPGFHVAGSPDAEGGPNY
jgi:Flp pilus assembly protein TadD